MKRRQFIALIGGTAAAWSLAARAQPAERMRRIGVLMNVRSDEPEGQARVTAFVQEMQRLGWTEGSNVRTAIRWAVEAADFPRYAGELVALAPDVILASASPAVAALQRVTSSVPIVFGIVVDPVGAGFVNSLARPGGNTTGFTAFEYSISGKWLDLLKALAPGLKRVAVLRDPSAAASIGQFAVIQSVASSSGIELSAIDSRDANEIERGVATLGREPNGGLIVTAAGSAVTHRNVIISQATRHRLPNIYPFRYYPLSGGLASYGPNSIDGFTRAAAYVDRILKGAKPSDLPVQTPTKYELVINLKTAKAMGIEIPASLLNTADEVIE